MNKLKTIKAQIDKDGILYLEKAGKFKKQKCPYSAAAGNGCYGFTENCSDSCPHFYLQESPYETYNLFLCNNNIYHIFHDDLIDERILND